MPLNNSHSQIRVIKKYKNLKHTIQMQGKYILQ